jgi:GMP synthase (glutamine-hydrolysing)
MGFSEIVEPLRALFKDEVRQVGIELGMPEDLAWRQPFPGPGLAVRVLGEITPDRLAILREADAIFREEVDAAPGLARGISQYFAVLTDLRSVGVTSGARSYENVIALRAVRTRDFMTAEFSHIPFEILERVSARITTEVPHINRIVYDITNKPPSTIEWE